jgi:uncharacterized membrane-anchored protein YhcB (DUF1043 family)
MEVDMWVYRADAYIAGFFLGCMALCMLMLAVPEKKTCEISIMKQGSQVVVTHVGVVTKY